LRIGRPDIDEKRSPTTSSTNCIDDITELDAPVPYTAPLKGIQVKIRVFEPDSRQIREITVVEDF
jgi:hypothetical protein